MSSTQGIVFSSKMVGSAIVVVNSSWSHPLYQKIIRRSKKYLVDNKIGAVAGDHVIIVETKPISKNKCWAIKEVIKK